MQLLIRGKVSKGMQFETRLKQQYFNTFSVEFDRRLRRFEFNLIQQVVNQVAKSLR